MEETVKICKALSDSTRSKMFFVLSRKTLCVNELVNLLQISQPAVSQHLNVLKQADLVRAKRKGYWIHYSVNRRRVKTFLTGLNSLLGKDRLRKRQS